MTRDRLQHRVDELFLAAIEQPATERADFLKIAARDDPPEVTQRVMELIAADERAGTKFAARSPLNLREFSAEDICDPRLGECIDDYVIKARIASGGFGTVYHATRNEPYVEHVAIKLLHRDCLAAPQIVRRVLREMQALSDLRHPYIVSQLHANVTAAGEPYLVMEYIDGKPLDQFCNERQLAVRDRLQLFQKICDAVHFAHQHGWVHRDLKPGNILVTADATPKLLDFGIAKLVGPAADEPGETRTRDVLGTPEYMSPEQFTGQTAGAATDVYALGAVLYELISGRRVFDVICQRVDKHSFDAVQGAIHDSIPRRPSTLAESDHSDSTGLTKERIADQRSSSPVGLRRCLEGDIDNIAMMALRKEPSRRYQTAAAVSEDIQRWLEHRPVMARPDALSYRARKYLRRNRRGLLVCVTIASCFLIVAATIQRGRQALQKRDSERAFRQIESAQHFLEDDIHQGIAHLHAAYQMAGPNSEMRAAAARMLSGWCRYLGTPLGCQANIRYAFDRDARRLAVFQSDGFVDIWETEALAKQNSFAVGDVVCHDFSTTGTLLLTVNQKGRASCWDIVSQRLRAEQPVGRGIMACLLQPTHAHLVQAVPGKVRLLQWKFQDDKVRELASRSLSEELRSAEFIDDSELVVTLHSDGLQQVVVWDGKSLRQMRTIGEPRSRLIRRRIDCQHRLVAQSYREGTRAGTIITDLHTEAPAEELAGEVLDIDRTGGQFLLKEQRHLRLVGMNEYAGLSRSWDTAFHGHWDAVFGHGGDIRVVEVLAGSSRRHTRVTFLGSDTVTSRLWHPFFSQEAHGFDRAELSPDGRFVVFDTRLDRGTANTRVPWLWALDPFRTDCEEIHLEQQARQIGIGGDWIVATSDRGLGCWNLQSGHESHRSLADVTAVSVAHDMPLAVVGDAQGTLHYLRLGKLQTVKTVLVTPRQAIRSIDLQPAATRVLVATAKDVCLVADSAPLSPATKPRRVMTSERVNSAFVRARFSTAGKSFAVASGDALHHYRGDRRQRHYLFRLDLSGHLGDFSVSETSALVATIDSGEVHLLDRQQTLATVGVRRDCESVALRGDGLVLAVGYANGDVRFWDTLTRRPLSKPLRAGDDAISQLAFSADGTRLLSASKSGAIRVWSSTFALTVDRNLLRPQLEMLSGRHLDPFAVDQVRQLDKSEWQACYDRLQGRPPN